MKITYCRSYEEMSEQAASIMFSCIQRKSNLLFCAATGSSPTGLYQKLVNRFGITETLAQKLRLIKLDEWGGVPENHEVTCEKYLQTHLLKPLKVSSDRYISFRSDPEDPKEECIRMQGELDREGPVDVCVLGIGKNGHIGFNEPGEYLQAHCHYAELTHESLSHSMVQSMDKKPAYGLTLGMGDILNSGMILLLITGQQKREVTKMLLEKKVRTDLPASFLWLHNNVECLIDQSVIDR